MHGYSMIRHNRISCSLQRRLRRLADFSADASQSNSSIHEEWLQPSSLIWQEVSRKTLLANAAALPLFCLLFLVALYIQSAQNTKHSASGFDGIIGLKQKLRRVTQLKTAAKFATQKPRRGF